MILFRNKGIFRLKILPMKKVLLLLLTATFNLFSQAPANGLVAYYPFCGNSSDASGNSNHLFPYGTPSLTTDRFGSNNNAYLFNGSNDYFQANTYGPMNAHSRSVTFWAKTSTPFDYDGFSVLFYGGPNNFGTRFEVGLNGQCNSLYNDIGFGQMATAFNTPDNNWHFYAVTYDSTLAKNLTSSTFYVDGILQSNFCYNYGANTALSTTTGSPITVGHLYPGNPRFFNGKLDEIRLYDRPLSSSEVLAIYNSSCSCTALTAPDLIGNVTVCLNSSNVYSINPVSGASSYNWTLPTGWSGTSTTNTISTMASGTSGLISVIVNGTCGAAATSPINVVVQNCVGLFPAQKSESIRVFPNPTTGDLFIESTDNNISIKLVDLLGNIISREHLKKGRNQFEMKQTSPGIYFLIIEGEKERTIKVIKQ